MPGLTPEMRTGSAAKWLNSHLPKPLSLLAKALYIHRPIGKGVRTEELPKKALFGAVASAALTSSKATVPTTFKLSSP